jgi:hypothetical protein
MVAKSARLAALCWAGALSTLAGCQLVPWQSESVMARGADVSKDVPVVSSAPYGAGKDSGAQGRGARQQAPNEAIVSLQEQLAAAKDDRSVLEARMEVFRAQLEEKDKALALASREIQEATAQLARTRNDLMAWQKEMVALRDRQGRVEKEGRETLEATIKMLEKMLEAPAPRVESPAPAPELLPVPQKIQDPHQ